MPGAYTSKPDAVVATPVYPNIPVDWNPIWAWPGFANPPGYGTTAARAAILLASDSTVDAGSETAANTKFIDTTGNGPMGVPSEDFVQTWSATIDGAPLLLKKSGGVYASSIEYGYYAFGLFMGADEDIQFDISASDAGSTIVLTATSVDGEETYTDTSSITVNEPPTTNYVKITFSRVDVFGAEGVLVASVPGGTATFDSSTNSVTGVTGVLTITGTREVTLAAEDLDALAPGLLAGAYSATSTSGLITNPRSSCACQLYWFFGVPYTGESASHLFSPVLDPFGSDTENQDIATLDKDTITDLT